MWYQRAILSRRRETQSYSCILIWYRNPNGESLTNVLQELRGQAISANWAAGPLRHRRARRQRVCPLLSGACTLRPTPRTVFPRLVVGAATTRGMRAFLFSGRSGARLLAPVPQRGRRIQPRGPDRPSL